MPELIDALNTCSNISTVINGNQRPVRGHVPGAGAGVLSCLTIAQGSASTDVLEAFHPVQVTSGRDESNLIWTTTDDIHPD